MRKLAQVLHGEAAFLPALTRTRIEKPMCVHGCGTYVCLGC